MAKILRRFSNLAGTETRPYALSVVLTVCEGLLLALELRARAYGSVRHSRLAQAGVATPIDRRPAGFAGLVSMRT